MALPRCLRTWAISEVLCTYVCAKFQLRILTFFEWYNKNLYFIILIIVTRFDLCWSFSNNFPHISVHVHCIFRLILVIIMKYLFQNQRCRIYRLLITAAVFLDFLFVILQVMVCCGIYMIMTNRHRNTHS
jgi:hypothetical protein